jgi:hypothetical protein
MVGEKHREEEKAGRWGLRTKAESSRLRLPRGRGGAVRKRRRSGEKEGEGERRGSGKIRGKQRGSGKNRGTGKQRGRDR